MDRSILEKNKIKELKNSFIFKVVDKKKILANFSLRFTGNIISKLLGFITLPIVARALGPDLFGSWNLIIAILGYIAIPINFGFTPYGLREVAKKHGNTELVVNKILSARLLLTFFSLVVSTLVIVLIYHTNSVLLISIIVGYILVVSQAVNIEFYYLGTKKLFLPTVSQLCGQLFYVLGTLFFVKKQQDFILLIILYSSYYLINSLINILYYLKDSKIKKVR